MAIKFIFILFYVCHHYPFYERHLLGTFWVSLVGLFVINSVSDFQGLSLTESTWQNGINWTTYRSSTCPFEYTKKQNKYFLVEGKTESFKFEIQYLTFYVRLQLPFGAVTQGWLLDFLCRNSYLGKPQGKLILLCLQPLICFQHSLFWQKTCKIMILLASDIMSFGLEYHRPHAFCCIKLNY